MKTTKILYWIFTGLMAAFMLLGAIPDVLRIPAAVDVSTHLGYPAYLLPFIGVAKILGVIAVLVPGFQRLKERAYAGTGLRPGGRFVLAHRRRRPAEQLGLSDHRVAFSVRVLPTP